MPVSRGEPIFQDHARDADRIEPLGDLLPLVVHRQEAVAPAGADHDRSPVGQLGLRGIDGDRRDVRRPPCPPRPVRRPPRGETSSGPRRRPSTGRSRRCSTRRSEPGPFSRASRGWASFGPRRSLTKGVWSIRPASDRRGPVSPAHPALSNPSGMSPQGSPPAILAGHGRTVFISRCTQLVDLIRFAPEEIGLGTLSCIIGEPSMGGPSRMGRARPRAVAHRAEPTAIQRGRITVAKLLAYDEEAPPEVGQWRVEAGEGRAEHPRAPRAQRRDRQGLGQPHRHQGRRHRRRGDRADRPLREHGGAARQGGRLQDLRRRRRRHDHRHRPGRGDLQGRASAPWPPAPTRWP